MLKGTGAAVKAGPSTPMQKGVVPGTQPGPGVPESTHLGKRVTFLRGDQLVSDDAIQLGLDTEDLVVDQSVSSPDHGFAISAPEGDRLLKKLVESH